MATTSEVKAGLDDIAQRIRSSRKGFALAKDAIVKTRDGLNAIPTQYADVLNTIGLYGTADAFEALSKDELAKLTTEFVALRNSIDALIAAAGI